MCVCVCVCMRVWLRASVSALLSLSLSLSLSHTHTHTHTRRNARVSAALLIASVEMRWICVLPACSLCVPCALLVCFFRVRGPWQFVAFAVHKYSLCIYWCCSLLLDIYWCCHLVYLVRVCVCVYIYILLDIYWCCYLLSDLCRSLLTLV